MITVFGTLIRPHKRFGYPPFTDVPIPLPVMMEERVSCTLSAGIKVTICKGPVALIDFDKHRLAGPAHDPDSPEWDSSNALDKTLERVKILNAFALCVHAARVIEEETQEESFRITHQELFHIDNTGRLSGYGAEDVLRAAREAQHNPWNMLHQRTINTAFKMLDAILTHEYPRTLELAVLLHDSLTECCAHNYSATVSTAWTVCEVLQDKAWREYFEGQCPTLSRQRRDKLTGRDFTASVVGEALELAGVLPRDLHQKLDSVRAARNKYLHDLRPANMSLALDALKAATNLFKETLNVDIRISPVLSWVAV